MNKHYEATAHRTDKTSFDEIQKGNQQWWTNQTMSYDWGEKSAAERFSLPWYEQVDKRFVFGARLFAHDKEPFDRIIPYAEIKGKRVLEIGCGMGFHTELLIRAGADVTSVDLSETSIEATRKRLEVKGLKGDVIHADAEKLPFDDKTFDFVWSWGVIHHSSRTGRIVREIARVLKPDGETRIMVYYRYGGSAKIMLAKYHWLRFGFLRRSPDESLNRGTDGFHARYYNQDQFEDLFRGHFQDVKSMICGQDVDALMLPRRLRMLALKVVSEKWLKRKQAQRGGFIFLEAKNPS